MSCNSRHDAWLAAGHCPAVHWTRTWCNLGANHRDRHYAPHEYPDRTEPFYWTDRDNAEPGTIPAGRAE